jgi:DNA-binding MarR family transcriptional regulator
MDPVGATTDITQSTGYLLTQVCRAHRNKAQELLARLELYPGQEMMLLHLWPRDGLTQSELCDDLCVSAATVTKMLDRMVAAGLVERRHDEQDQRISRVYLTAKGAGLQRPVEALWQALDEITFAGLTLPEQLLLRRLFLHIYGNLT